MDVSLRGFSAVGLLIGMLSGALVGCSGSSAPSALDIRDPAMPSSTSPPPLSAAAETPPLPAPHVRQVAQPVSADRIASRSDVRVMSFNVRVAIFIDAMNHWEFRKGLLVETIRSFDPDLLGTQEALAAQSDYLRRELYDYDFVGAGRSDGARRGEMCGVFFRKARFDKLDAGHFWLSSTPNRPGSKSWGSSFPRMVTWVRLRDRADGNVFCLFNTHFDHRGRHAREESARLLRSRVHAIAGDLPVIITGDFNATEESAPYRTLIAGARRGDERFTDTYRAVNRNPNDDREGTRHDFGGGHDGPRIDWIFTSGGFRTVTASIDRTRAGGRYPSDHFPVTAVLRPAAPTGVARVE